MFPELHGLCRTYASANVSNDFGWLAQIPESQKNANKQAVFLREFTDCVNNLPPSLFQPFVVSFALLTYSLTLSDVVNLNSILQAYCGILNA